MSKLRPYSQQIILAHHDGRSKAGRLLKSVRKTLIEHLGGEDKITPLQRALVERAAMLQLQVSALDKLIIDGAHMEYDAKTYLAWSNSLTHTLRALGLGPTATSSPRDPMSNLCVHLASRRGGSAAA